VPRMPGPGGIPVYDKDWAQIRWELGASFHCLHMSFWAAPPKVLSFRHIVYGQPHRATVSAGQPFQSLQSS